MVLATVCVGLSVYHSFDLQVLLLETCTSVQNYIHTCLFLFFVSIGMDILTCFCKLLFNCQIDDTFKYPRHFC